MNIRKAFLSLAVCASAVAVIAQVETSGTVRRRTANDKKKTTQSGQVTDRMQDFFEHKETHDADLAYMREIYRQLDLTKPKNTPLYFPEDIIDGQENLFRTIMRLVVDGEIPAYEYLDGREVFSDQYKIDVGEMLDRFDIYYTTQGSGNHTKYVIAEADVPTNQVLNYYIIEKWEFDRRSNSMKTRVVAICPVLNKIGDFGGETRYPMFWVKFDALRPWLAQSYIFLDDDNNLPTYSLDDYFTMGMYDGDIYKTKNLRNLSMMQMYPDEDEMMRAQDSIDNRLRNFGKDLWVPTREEYLARQEAERLAKEAADTLAERPMTIVDENEGDGNDQKGNSVRKNKRTAKKKSSAPKAPKAPKVKNSSPSQTGNSNATKSVRRRKK